jgi:hypothetical protein
MPKTSTYTVHGHMKNRDGTLSAFWTHTRLSKAQAQKLAKEQRAEAGGVAEIVAEDRENSPPAYGKPGDPPPAKIYDKAEQKWVPAPQAKRHHATKKKSSAQLTREINEALSRKVERGEAAPYEGMRVLVTKYGAMHHGLRPGVRGVIKRVASPDVRFGPSTSRASVLVNVHGAEFSTQWPTAALRVVK